MVQNALDLELRSNIKEQLSRKDMSVRELEKRSGLKYSVVQNILHGRSKNPTIKVVQLIAKELGCSIEDLIGASDKNGLDLSNNPLDVKPSNKGSPWNKALFIDAVFTVEKLLEAQGVSFSKEDLMSCAEEIYQYSIGFSDKADMKFAQWIIGKFLKKE